MENVTETAETVETQESTITEQVENTENTAPSTETTETTVEKTFTQKELDEIITKRLERDRETTSKKAAQEARDSLIVEENITYNGKQIKTESEYREMLKEQNIRKQYEGKVDDDILNEIVEGKKFREQYEAKEQETKTKAQQDADFQAFIETYPEVKEVPQNVWDEVAKGKSLVDAYAKHENMTLKQQLAELTKAKEIEALNEQNAQSSTGSVTGQGNVDLSFISADTFEKNRSDAGWVKKNFNKIMESRAKW